ncbi:HIG1 domain family member 1C [Eufriesea mexicana]|uniref:HIG1 domain family member 1C n=1 Tax=Eufriesea mexicana TaxID=516756 RepID=A0A310SNX2_9HYME|nr:PREDICTED: HIG1 domain family member 1A, mitochondrial-like [Eufriesea mexicana]XP_017759055.1 PREDICTED: HIG1 domain family member 1A, mitochondrial-like [Eufriesea mexicana]OAD55909.1 HIG1 domain family member 1C [Eufriesea mexicana]
MDDSIWKNAVPIEIPEEAYKQTLQHEAPLSDRLYGLMQRSPSFVVGIVGLCAICGIGAYNWKSKKIKPSIYLLQLRLAAQGTIIGCLGFGTLYAMYKDLMSEKKE